MTWKRLWALVAADVRIEFRAKQFLLTTATFGILLLFVLGIALDAAARMNALWSSGVLWLVIFFTTAIGMTRQDVKERELGALQALRMMPGDTSLIYYSKWLSTALFTLVSEIALLLAFFVILNQPVPAHPVRLVLVLLFGTFSLTGIGTFLVSISANSQMRDILLPILLFPLSIPLFLAVIRITAAAMSAAVSASIIWTELLAGYLIVFSVLPWLLYELLLEV